MRSAQTAWREVKNGFRALHAPDHRRAINANRYYLPYRNQIFNTQKLFMLLISHLENIEMFYLSVETTRHSVPGRIRTVAKETSRASPWDRLIWRSIYDGLSIQMRVI